ncbi:hypothetical protein [Streptomyces sp. N50]|uniref:hypothetical protein n=1 Tax=Streptomyces sp. N50 TaxID=3081765 RepID=UPI002961F067|nr:hypothetical protein [Streptomyces sp. N50]WOX10321.1 hypothetical protein R2B38_16365 [Streptomyces sp. N50]
MADSRKRLDHRRAAQTILLALMIRAINLSILATWQAPTRTTAESTRDTVTELTGPAPHAVLPYAPTTAPARLPHRATPKTPGSCPPSTLPRPRPRSHAAYDAACVSGPEKEMLSAYYTGRATITHAWRILRYSLDPKART